MPRSRLDSLELSQIITEVNENSTSKFTSSSEDGNATKNINLCEGGESESYSGIARSEVYNMVMTMLEERFE